MFEFKFPDVGEGVHEGKILQYKINPGEKVDQGDILAIIETDKVVAEIPSSQAGTLIRFGVEEGQIIHVGETLAFIELENAKTTKAAEPIEESAGVVGQLESAGSFIMPASGEGLSDSSSDTVTLGEKIELIRATPLARRMARELGIDLSKVKGSGPQSRVMRDDILKLKELKVETKEETGKLSTQLSTMRKTIASKMEEANNIPVATFHESCEIDKLKKFRDEANKNLDWRLSFQPIFIKALAIALKKFPEFNATYDSQSKEITTYQEINIGLAVETKKGLMVPVIKNIEKKTISEIGKEMLQLVAKGKDGLIGLDDLRGGTFSITNYGAFGGLYGNPLILAPQVAIMGFGRIHEAPIVRAGALVVGTILPISFTFDHRVTDGVPAARFVSYLKELLSNPERMILDLV